MRNTKTDDTFNKYWPLIIKFYDGKCAYCMNRPWVDIDHVVPTSRGGLHSAHNVVPACKSCNSSKRDSWPEGKWSIRKPHPWYDVTRYVNGETRYITHADADADADADAGRKSPSPEKTFGDLWISAYEKRFEKKYLYQGAKDMQAAKRLVKAESPEGLISIAEKAWRDPSGFNTKQAISISGFASRFNEIRADVGMAKSKSSGSGWTS